MFLPGVLFASLMARLFLWLKVSFKQKQNRHVNDQVNIALE